MVTGEKIGVIGAGNMGSAIIKGILRAALFAPNEIVVFDVIREKTDDLSRTLRVDTRQAAAEVAKAAGILIIAVKPQAMEACLSEIKDTVNSVHTIISIAAGISIGFLEQRLPASTRVIRVMPNTPALIGEGATAICAGSFATEKDMALAEKIFGAVGKVFNVPESLMDAVTAVSGSGPAYLFYFAECLSDVAEQAGIPRQQAISFVTQTILGAAKLLVESGDEAPVLRAKVTSPGGTTEAALKVLKERGFDAILASAVMAAVKRGRELGGVKIT